MLIAIPNQLPVAASLLLSALTCLAVPCQVASQQPAAAATDNSSDLLDEVSQLVVEHFFDPGFDPVAWQQQVAALRLQTAATNNEDQVADLINQLLATLKSSHTYYFSTNNPKRYQLLGVFHCLYGAGETHLFRYEGIGLDTLAQAKPPVVSAVYDGLPASLAGVRYGDRLLRVDGMPFHAMNSFRGKAGKQVDLEIQRGDESLHLPVTVDWLDGRTMFETALQSSIRIIEKGGMKIGYLHVWSYAGTQFQDAIRDTILFGELSQCDGLILDLRDGWGGADVNYLNLFRSPIVSVDSTSRNGETRSLTGVWGKPVNLIINQRSTSGKEMFALGFRKLQLGEIIGETSAGAVLAGRAFLLSNGAVLYLAVSDVTVDGQRLEGRGVTPDKVVSRSPTEANGEDPQIETATTLLLQQLARNIDSHPTRSK